MNQNHAQEDYNQHHLMILKYCQYGNHYEQVKEQVSREPRPFPKLKINPRINSIDMLDDLKFEDFEITDYDPHPALKGEITVVGGFDEKDRAKWDKKEEKKG